MLAANFRGNLHKAPYPLDSSCQIGRTHRGPDRLGPKKGRAGLSRGSKLLCCSFNAWLHPHTTTRNAPFSYWTVLYSIRLVRLVRPSLVLGCELHAAAWWRVSSPSVPP